MLFFTINLSVTAQRPVLQPLSITNCSFGKSSSVLPTAIHSLRYQYWHSPLICFSISIQSILFDMILWWASFWQNITNGAYGQAAYPSPFVKSTPIVVAPQPAGHLYTTIANFSPMYQSSYPTAPPPFQPIHQMYHPQPGYYTPAQPIQNIPITPHNNMPPVSEAQSFLPDAKSSLRKFWMCWFLSIIADWKFVESTNFGVKLTVSNIDAQLGVNAIQDILLKEVSSYCQVNCFGDTYGGILNFISIARIETVGTIVQNWVSE